MYNMSSLSTAVLVLAWSVSLAGCSRVAVPIPERVILITLDTTRADRLGSYGYGEGLTPHLDELAANGLLFERALAPMATTFPSHASMLTGLYPRFHGVRWNGDRLPTELTTVPETLAERGWETGAFVAYKAMLFRGGLDQGFTTVSDASPIPGEPRIRDGRAVTDLALEWLAEREDDIPFFLWIHYFEPHGPYEVTPYSKAKLAAYRGRLAQGASLSVLNTSVSEILDSPEDLSALRTLYDGEIAQMDGYVGEVLNLLEARSWQDETLICVVGDHGQALGEHGQHGHGPMLWDVVLRVPMILRVPAVAPARITETVSLVDLAPTLLDLLGVSVDGPVQGKSLLPVFGGGRLRRPVFSETRVPGRVGAVDDQPRELAVHLDSFKLVLRDDTRSLYDLARDPDEEVALQEQEHATVRSALEAAAQRYLTTRISRGAAALTSEDLEELRALGYL